MLVPLPTFAVTALLARPTLPMRVENRPEVSCTPSPTCVTSTLPCRSTSLLRIGDLDLGIAAAGPSFLAVVSLDIIFEIVAPDPHPPPLRLPPPSVPPAGAPLRSITGSAQSLAALNVDVVVLSEVLCISVGR